MHPSPAPSSAAAVVPSPGYSPVAGRGDSPDLRRGALFMLLSAVAFSLMSLCVKVASDPVVVPSVQLPTMQIVFARSLFMAVLCAVLLRSLGQSLVGVNHRILISRGIAGGTALSLLYAGLALLPLGDAVTIHYTAPVWTALLATIVLREPLRPLVLAGVAVCLAGVVLVFQPSALFGRSAEPLPLVGVAAVMGGSVLSGLAYTFVRKLRSSDAPLTIIFYLSWIGAVGSLPFALLGDGWVWPPPVGWLLLLGVGVTTQVGQFALTRGLHLLEAGTATAIGYVQILFAFLWAVLFFGDTPDTLSLVGAAVILSSVLLIVRRS